MRTLILSQVKWFALFIWHLSSDVLLIDSKCHTEPRYASLPNIMKAKKKPVEKLKPEDLSIDLKPVLETLKVTEPPARKGGQKVRIQPYRCLEPVPTRRDCYC